MYYVATLIKSPFFWFLMKISSMLTYIGILRLEYRACVIGNSTLPFFGLQLQITEFLPRVTHQTGRGQIRNIPYTKMP